jgi:hypothetical protein
MKKLGLRRKKITSTIFQYNVNRLHRLLLDGKLIHLNWEVVIMNNNEQNATIISNDALRGKPYLDIDRVITEGNPKKSNQSRNEK